MHSKLALNEAIQVGPWRVARKHLLFVVLFCVSMIAFGIVILLTHVFDNKNWEEEEEDEEEEEEDEEETHWLGNMEQRFSTGDWIVVAIMISAALMAIGAMMACFMVRNDAPRRLSQRRASIYSVQFNKSDRSPTNKGPAVSSAPQQLPVWTGQVQLPQGASSSHQNPVQITVSNLPSNAKIPPPPYSP